MKELQSSQPREAGFFLDWLRPMDDEISRTREAGPFIVLFGGLNGRRKGILGGEWVFFEVRQKTIGTKRRVKAIAAR